MKLLLLHRAQVRTNLVACGSLSLVESSLELLLPTEEEEEASKTKILFWSTWRKMLKLETSYE